MASRSSSAWATMRGEPQAGQRSRRRSARRRSRQAVAAEGGHPASSGQSQAAPRTPEESPCMACQDRVSTRRRRRRARSPRQAVVERVDVGHAAAQHDDVGIEDVDDTPARGRAGRRSGRGRRGRAGRRRGRRDDLDRRQCFPAVGAMIAAKPGPETQVSRQPRRPHQQAGPGRSSSRGPGQGGVAPFAGDAVGARRRAGRR